MQNLSYRIYDRDFHGNWGSTLGVFILCTVNEKNFCIEQKQFPYSEREMAIEWAENRIKQGVDCKTCMYKKECFAGMKFEFHIEMDEDAMKGLFE